MNGIELALRIREREHDRAVQIVFVTGYMDYIEKGYDVEALHYLLKPVTQERLFGVLDRAAQRVRDRGRELCLQMPEGTARIPVSEIRYLEVQRNYVTIHGDEDYTVKRTLGELERGLDGRFFRTGRSYIVNLQFVKKITRSQIVLKDGAQIPLPRRAYEDINRAMIRYF
ncbi:MAG: response regulator transcription factor [Lachnospiraceae bacterium]|nr:response regulator transcription factor [Lachnospiraceae bacterium]